MKISFKNFVKFHKIIIASAVLITVSTSSLTAVDTNTDGGTGKQNVADNKQNENTTYFQAGKVVDETLKVGNFSFRKMFHPAGQGEYLDVYFDINNQIDKKRNLKVFFFGFWEDDRSKTKFRKYTIYPAWRQRDYDKEIKDILFLDSKPELKKDEVFDFIVKNKPKNMKPAIKDYDRADGSKPKEGKDLRFNEHPDFLDYVQYIVNNPDKGVDLQVWGMEGNVVEKETDYRKEIGGFTIINSTLKTVVLTKLYSRYRADRKFFNHVGVVLYDTDDKKIVFSQYIRFTKQLKLQ